MVVSRSKEIWLCSSFLFQVERQKLYYHLGVWVEEVKDALLSHGEWPTCYGPYNDEIIRNPDFECGISSQWSFSVLGSAEASLTETENVVIQGRLQLKLM